MRPYDCLTNEDREGITKYIQAHTNCVSGDLKLVLKHWDKSKTTLFKMLGRKLRIDPIKVELPFTYNDFLVEVSNIYHPYRVELDKNHEFIISVMRRFDDEIKAIRLPRETVGKFNDLIAYKNVFKGALQKDMTFYKYLDNGDMKECKFPQGTKTMRAVQKVIKFYDLTELLPQYEDWRNAVSNLMTKKKIKADLVFSIHPIDYMTMSDNNCGWSSCLSWKDNGSCSEGVVEMMNSNNVVIAYLQSKKKFLFDGHKIPNKKWRCLFYVHKNIICSGKSYPYGNDTLTRFALDKLAEFAKNNLNWQYQYKNEEYQDLKHFYANWWLRTSGGDEKRNILGKDRHTIVFYTDGMYNDLVMDHKTKYWCYRNYVEKPMKICVSGRATCLCCGKPMDSDLARSQAEDFSMAGHSSAKICDDCIYDHLCGNCRKINKNVNLLTIRVIVPKKNKAVVKRICEDCIDEYWYDKTKSIFILKNDLANTRLKRGTIDSSNLIPAKEVLHVH